VQCEKRGRTFWEYKKIPRRVGETLEFETDRYHLTGPIVSIGEVQSWR